MRCVWTISRIRCTSRSSCAGHRGRCRCRRERRSAGQRHRRTCSICSAASGMSGASSDGAARVAREGIVALAVAVLTLLLAWRALRLDTRRRRRRLWFCAPAAFFRCCSCFSAGAQAAQRHPPANHYRGARRYLRIDEPGEGSGETRAARVAALLTREQPELPALAGPAQDRLYTFGDRLQAATVESLTRSGGPPIARRRDPHPRGAGRGAPAL